MNSIIIVLIVFIVFVFLIYSLVSTCESKKEPWVDYQQLPYGNVQSGAGNSNGIRPLSFYDYASYRQPLNWPICHLVDYPVPHCRADSL